MKINKKAAQGKWYKYPGSDTFELKIRPFSVFSSNIPPNQKDITVKDIWQVINYCVVEWKGIFDEDNNTVNCTEENKKMVFDFDQDLVRFVDETVKTMSEGIISEKESKN